jgi:hypothetical protein
MHSFCRLDQLGAFRSDVVVSALFVNPGPLDRFSRIAVEMARRFLPRVSNVWFQVTACEARIVLLLFDARTVPESPDFDFAVRAASDQNYAFLGLQRQR